MNRNIGTVKMKAGFLAGWVAGFRAARLPRDTHNRAAFAEFLKHGRTAARVVLLGLESFTRDDQHAIDEMVAFYDSAFAEYEREVSQRQHGGSENAGTESQTG